MHDRAYLQLQQQLLYKILNVLPIYLQYFLNCSILMWHCILNDVLKTDSFFIYKKFTKFQLEFTKLERPHRNQVGDQQSRQLGRRGGRERRWHKLGRYIRSRLEHLRHRRLRLGK